MPAKSVVEIDAPIPSAPPRFEFARPDTVIYTNFGIDQWIDEQLVVAGLLWNDWPTCLEIRKVFLEK